MGEYYSAYICFAASLFGVVQPNKYFLSLNRVC